MPYPRAPIVAGDAERRLLGQWYTAAPVADLALAALAPQLDARVLDPTCGDGSFLAAASQAGLARLTGVEIDADAAARARGRLPGAAILDGDALDPALPSRLGTFDAVIGNPPYLRAGRVDPALKRARAETLASDWPELDRALVERIARHADVAATCLLRALRLVRPGGALALVVSTALLDADGASAVWEAVEQLARVEALIVAPGERWFAEAAVNSMLVVARRRSGDDTSSAPRVLRLRVPTEVAARGRGLEAIAACADERRGDTADTWRTAVRAPDAWFAWRELAGDALVPLGDLAELRRGLTTGANDVFYLSRTEARQRKLEPRFLSPVVRSPFNGAPTPIPIAPKSTPVVAITLPPDANLARAPRIAAWLAAHETRALATSARRRDPWWSLPADPARLFLAKAYGPRFVQRLADVPMLADQRVYAVHPRQGVDVVALAAILNALPTTLALEALGRAAMGFGVVEHTVHDALALPVLDVRRATTAQRDRLVAALGAFGRRPIEAVRAERARPDRADLDAAAFGLVGGSDLASSMWDALIASVALRDRYYLPPV